MTAHWSNSCAAGSHASARRARTSGVKNTERVQSFFDALVQRPHFGSRGGGPPFHLGQADTVFTRDHSLPGQNLVEQFVEGRITPAFGIGLRKVHHDIDVNVAIAGMAEAGYGQPVFFLEPGRVSKKILQPAPGHRDVLVELGQSGIAERIRELPAQLPDGLALPGALRLADENGPNPRD